MSEKSSLSKSYTKSPEESQFSIDKYDPPDLAASILVKNKNNVWINDSLVTNCHKCKIKFGYFFTRKHHCRHCGNVFCDSCSSHTIAIPNFIHDKPDVSNYWGVSNYILPQTDEVRVCNECYNLIKEKREIYEQIYTLLSNPCSIDKIKYYNDVRVRKYYYDYLRNIQYYLPNHEYSVSDKSFLKVNAVYFSKHSKYLLHLIKCIEWDCLDKESNEKNMNFIWSVLNGDRVKECKELFCTRTCQARFSCDDCFNILYSCGDNLPHDLLDYMFGIIRETPEEVLLCHLPLIVNLIKCSIGKYIRNLLFELINMSDKLVYQSYWLLKSQGCKCKDQETSNVRAFIDLFDRDFIRVVHSSYNFYAELIRNLDNPAKFLAREFNNYYPIVMPFDPSIYLIGYEQDTIVTKKSSNHPTIITFDTNIGKKRILFKKEYIMNDLIVMNLITLCDIVLAETLNQNFGIVTYNVLPIDSNSGMIEIVENAETVYEITNKNKTILQFIIENNENEVIENLLDRYMYSLVSYTLHSYFLGLGDRHLENIMVKNNGVIFHIDFGYIMGRDAYPVSSEIKINSNMLDVLLCSKKDRYGTYIKSCAQGVVILRKFFNMFFVLLNQLENFNDKEVNDFILTRFQPRQSDKIIVDEVVGLINKSKDTYMGTLRDILHYNKNTIPGRISNMIGMIKDVKLV